MKKLYCFLISVLVGGIFLPAFVLGAIVLEPPDKYERNPSGYSVTSPVNFSILVDDIEADLQIYPKESYTKWRVDIIPTIGENYLSPEFLLTDLDVNWQLDLPLGTYINVFLKAFHIEGRWDHVGSFEFNNNNPIFEVIEEGPQEYLILPLTSEIITGALAYTGTLFTDLNLLIVLIIGLPLAFLVIKKTISLVKAK